ncbi:MAG: TolC family protein [Bacteroidota bacterium]
MHNAIHIYLGLLLLCSPRLGSGQPLSDFLKGGETKNFALQAVQQEYRAALEKGPQVRQFPQPDFGLGTFLLPVETRLGAQQVRISAAQLFPWFGTLDARESLVLSQAASQYEKIASTALEVNFRIKTAYLRVYEIRMTRKIIQRNTSTLRALRQLALARVESGQGSAADVLRVDLKIQALEQELRILDQQSSPPLADFNQVLNRPLNTPLTVQDSFAFATLPYPPDTLAQHLRQHHPTLRMFDRQREAAQKAIDLNALDTKPSLGLGVDYLMVAPRSDATPPNNGRDILQLNAKVRIPLGRKQYQAKEREERLNMAALENHQADLESRLLAAIEKAFADHETARLKRELCTQQKATTLALRRILQTDYSSTGDHLVELLQLETDLVDYELQTLQATVQSQLARAALEQYLNL